MLGADPGLATCLVVEGGACRAGADPAGPPLTAGARCYSVTLKAVPPVMPEGTPMTLPDLFTASHAPGL